MAAAAAAAAAAEVLTAAEASTPVETPSESSVEARPTSTAAEKRRHIAAGTGSDRQHHRRHHHHHHRRRRHHHEKPTPTDVVAPPQPPSSTSPPSSSSSSDVSHRRQMYGTYHAWALKTYGDSAKTKTVTRKKYNRIVKILKGEEHSNAENSKFRFWVKAKGFRVGPPPSSSSSSSSGSAVAAAAETGRRGDHVLYVPCTAVKNGDSKEDSVFKRVAVVENFFDIIYNVHVEMDGRGGKHAGQKRTYKAIAETYAFLPREAVTNFLMQCHDCQKRMHAGVTPNGEVTSSDATATTTSPTITTTAAVTVVTKTTTTATTATETETTDGDIISDTGGARSGVNEDEDEEEADDNELDDGAGTSSPPHSTVDSDRCSEPPEIDFSIPITTTYMKHYRSLGYSTEEALNLENEVHESASRDGTTSSPEPSPVEIEEEMSPSSVKEDEDDDKVSIAVNGYDSPLDMSKADRTNGNDAINTSSNLALQPPPSTLPPPPPPPPPPFSASHPLNMSLNGETNRQVAHQQHRRSPSSAAAISSLPPPARFNASMAFRGRNCNNHHSRHHSRLQNENHLDGVSSHDELNNGICRESAPSPEDLSAMVKDEDDDEDDEVDDKLDAHKFDPERLKAFNMFVRLFVDENLDRMVPISKQPKEKIQAIIDSCARQFPEFSERSRKRIRTYLKSCRRTKRCRDQNGWEPGRPTPPHLTSAMAEQILAAACDNESNNAKRMRLGLEPMSTAISERVNGEATARQSAALKAYSETHHHNHRHHNHRNGVTPVTNGSSGIYTRGTRSNSVGSRSPNNHLATLQGGGPADLSMKKSTSPSSQQQQQQHQSAGKCPLNQSEVSAVRQLIAGYRESAAFLVRSADELEQLLLQQN